MTVFVATVWADDGQHSAILAVIGAMAAALVEEHETFVTE